MNNLSSLSVLVGRALIAYLFVPAGFAKLGDLAGSAAYTASGGLPGFFVYPALVLEIVGGLALLVGWQTRWAALALAGFTVVAAYLFHYQAAQAATEPMVAMMQMLMFTKNLAITGGLLVLAGFGAGAWSVDARTSGRTALA